MSKVISLCNKKGGVGKSVSSINLAVALTNLGKRVLVIDLDGQANSTGVLIGIHIIDKYISDLFRIVKDGMDFPSKDKYIYKSEDGVDFIASNTLLGHVEIELAPVMCRETILKRIIENFKEDYDYVILDCQPSIGIITINALSASDEIIVPVQSNDFFCLDGLSDLMNYVKLIKSNVNPNLKIAGILITKYLKNTNISKLVCQTVLENQAFSVFQSKISLSTKIAETAAVKESIFKYAPKSKAVIEYTNLAKEVLEL